MNVDRRTTERLKIGEFIWVIPFPSVSSNPVIGKVTGKEKYGFATISIDAGYSISTNRMVRRATKPEVMLAMLER